MNPNASQQDPFERVRFLSDRKRYEQALIDLETVTRERPNDVMGSIWRAELLFKLGRVPDALKAITEAIRQEPDYYYSYYLGSQIMEHISTGEEGALRFADEAIRLAPENSSGYSQKAKLLFKAGDFSQAIRVAMDGLKVNPNDLNCIQALGRSQGQSGDLLGAEATFRQGLAASPDGYFLYDLGVVLLVQGKEKEAEEVLRQSIADDPSQEHRVTMLLESLKRQGK